MFHGFGEEIGLQGFSMARVSGFQHSQLGQTWRGYWCDDGGTLAPQEQRESLTLKRLPTLYALRIGISGQQPADNSSKPLSAATMPTGLGLRFYGVGTLLRASIWVFREIKGTLIKLSIICVRGGGGGGFY